MGLNPPGPGPGGLLKIGEAAILTGVSPGRIRHYQALGLLEPSRSPSGYRYFSAADLVLLLQIDLLRSLGMGLSDIGSSLASHSRQDSLRDSLHRHRADLQAEQVRLQRLLEAMDLALASDDTSAEAVATLLASANSTPRDSLGIFGRLRRPLSEQAAAVYQDLLGGGWGLPVPSIFGRMLLPPVVTELLEQLARAQGYQELFRRVRDLAVRILQLAAGPSPADGPRRVAMEWVSGLIEAPLPVEVQAALDQTLPRIRELSVLNQGFQLWAESISPPAAEVLRVLERQAAARGQVVLGVLVAQRPPRQRRPEPSGKPRP
ncbi:MAG: MerR family transcriptional regulator [Candidatus Dormibacteria bacterium]